MSKPNAPILLPSEDAAQYQHELNAFIEALKPANEEELRLVRSQTDCRWRIDRLQRLETAILYKGHLEFAEKYADRPAIERQHMINADAYLKYERQLRNIHIQEARLRRTMDKDRAELIRLQTIRKREEAANGFEFSTSEKQPDSHLPTTRIENESATIGPLAGRPGCAAAPAGAGPNSAEISSN